MYILGAVEAFITTSGVEIADQGTNMRVFGTILWFILVSINYFGIKYVAKFGTPVLMVVLLSIVSMYIGCFVQGTLETKVKILFFLLKIKKLADEEKGLSGIDGLSLDHCEENNLPMYHTNNFFILLSIYFPSVTGNPPSHSFHYFKVSWLDPTGQEISKTPPKTSLRVPSAQT